MKGLKGFLLRLTVKESKLQKQQQELFDTMINSTGDTVKFKGKKTPAKWFREHFKYSNEEILEALGKDNIKCEVIKNMDHILKEFSGEKTVLNVMKQYKGELSKPMHPELKTY